MGAKERNKNYVLEKAKEVFLERGITGVSMADIAKKPISAWRRCIATSETGKR